MRRHRHSSPFWQSLLCDNPQHLLPQLSVSQSVLPSHSREGMGESSVPISVRKSSRSQLAKSNSSTILTNKSKELTIVIPGKGSEISFLFRSQLYEDFSDIAYARTHFSFCVRGNCCGFGKVELELNADTHCQNSSPSCLVYKTYWTIVIPHHNK